MPKYKIKDKDKSRKHRRVEEIETTYIKENGEFVEKDSKKQSYTLYQLENRLDLLEKDIKRLKNKKKSIKLKIRTINNEMDSIIREDKGNKK